MASSFCIVKLSGLGDVVVYERGRGLAGAVNLGRKTRGMEHDLALNMETYLRAVLPSLLSGARRRVGFGPGRRMLATRASIISDR